MLGETALTIRYKGHVVELPRVVVMTNQVTPFILGIEWIDAMRHGEKKRSQPERNEVVIEGPARDWII